MPKPQHAISRVSAPRQPFPEARGPLLHPEQSALQLRKKGLLLKGRIALAWLVGLGWAAHAADASNLKRFDFDRSEMAVSIKLVLYAPDAVTANSAAQTAFDRFHVLNSVASDYDPQSEVRRLCDTAGQGRAVPVSRDLWRILTVAQQVCERSDGAFDVTIGPLIRIWRRARGLHELPTPAKIAEARQSVGCRFVRFDPERRAVELLKPDMRIDLGAIAKGYAAHEALAEMKKQGINRALVHAGGDIALGDPPPDRTAWTVGVAAPDADSPPTVLLCLSNRYIATSGDSMQPAWIAGKRYSHIVDPKTGLGLTDHCTVTVVGPDGAVADALSTAVSLLGPEKGMKLVESYPGVAVHILRPANGGIQSWQSSTWNNLPKAPTPAVK